MHKMTGRGLLCALVAVVAAAGYLSISDQSPPIAAAASPDGIKLLSSTASRDEFFGDQSRVRRNDTDSRTPEPSTKGRRCNYLPYSGTLKLRDVLFKDSNPCN